MRRRLFAADCFPVRSALWSAPFMRSAPFMLSAPAARHSCCPRRSCGPSLDRDLRSLPGSLPARHSPLASDLLHLPHPPRSLSTSLLLNSTPFPPRLQTLDGPSVNLATDIQSMRDGSGRGTDLSWKIGSQHARSFECSSWGGGHTTPVPRLHTLSRGHCNWIGRLQEICSSGD